MSISKKILIISLLAAFLTFALVGFSLAQREPEIDYPEIPGAPEITRETILPDYIVYIFNFALMIIGLVAFGALIWGGVRYLTSIGNPAAMADAKDQIFAGLLGLIILLSSYLILTTINPELIFLGLGEEKIKIREPGERKISTTITLPVEFRAYAIGTPIAADFHESLGDVNWDRTINIFDAVVLSKVFGLTSEDAGYDPNCDLNFDERIDISDIAIMGKNLDKAVEIYHITEEESAGEGLTLYIPFERAKPSRIFQAVLDRNNIEGVEVRHAIATTDITPIEVDFHFLGILPKEVSPACTELTEEINARDGAACGDPNYDPLYDVNKDQIIDLFDVERVGDCKGDGACCNGLKDPASPCPAPTCDEMQSRITTAFGESCGDAFYDPIADINKDQIVDAFDAAAFAICGMDEACCQGLWDDTDPCPGPALTCIDLQDRISDAFGESCGDAFYDPIADINKDQIVDAFDAAAFAICGMDEACCQGLWDDTDPCPPPPSHTCVELQDRITDTFGESCGTVGYDPVADVNKDQTINVFDIVMLALCEGDDTCCDGLWDTTDPCP